MSLPANIQEKVLKGFVLNDQGEWIAISEKAKKEREFLSHLEAGEVLCNGKWMKISEAIKIQRNPESKFTGEIPDNYHEITDDARARASTINSTNTGSAETPDNPIFYPPETVCMETVLIEETMPETRYFDSIPDSNQNENSVSSIRETVKCTGIDNQPHDSVEIQNAISNINELISRKKNDPEKRPEEKLENQAPKNGHVRKKKHNLYLFLIILGIAVCCGNAIIVFLSLLK